MDGADVFFVEWTDRVALFLRRYSGGDRKCDKTGSYCNGQVFFCDAPAARDEEGYLRDVNADKPPHTDARWPTACDACGRGFAADDPHQLFQDQIMRAADGREFRHRELPPGACYDAWWDPTKGPDGRSLVVVLPTKLPWHIDHRASNCTMPGDNVHRCWVRHGKPEDGTLHVDKNGQTCAAGAGSIAVPGYHGFLHHGKLTAG